MRYMSKYQILMVRYTSISFCWYPFNGIFIGNHSHIWLWFFKKRNNKIFRLFFSNQSKIFRSFKFFKLPLLFNIDHFHLVNQVPCLNFQMKFGYFQKNTNSSAVHDTKRKTWKNWSLLEILKNPDESLRRISKKNNLNYPCKHN